jgi:hypothetical protein
MLEVEHLFSCGVPGRKAEKFERLGQLFQGLMSATKKQIYFSTQTND